MGFWGRLGGKSFGLYKVVITVPTIRYLSRKGVIMMFSLVVVGASPIGGIGISQR